MKWLDRWFAKKVKWAWHNHNKIVKEKDLVYQVDSHAPTRISHPSKDYVDFKLWFADNGGYILEFNKYDSMKDRHSSQIYIIPDGLEKLGDEITQVITQYVLSNR
jgi:hypothetical protein